MPAWFWIAQERVAVPAGKIQVQMGPGTCAARTFSGALLPCRWCKPCDGIAIKTRASCACFYSGWGAISGETPQAKAQGAHIFECLGRHVLSACTPPGTRGSAGRHCASGRQRQPNCRTSLWVIGPRTVLPRPMCKCGHYESTGGRWAPGTAVPRSLKPEPLHAHSAPVGQGHRALRGR